MRCDHKMSQLIPVVYTLFFIKDAVSVVFEGIFEINHKSNILWFYLFIDL